MLPRLIDLKNEASQKKSAIITDTEDLGKEIIIDLMSITLNF